VNRLRHFPFLLAGSASFAAFAVLLLADLPADSLASRAMVAVWQTLGAGPHQVANLLARQWPDLPGWLDALLILVLGLLPYLAADLLLAALLKRWRGMRAAR
jgi:hypothetical protein